MTGKIYNWNQKERLAVFQPEEESACTEDCLFLDTEQRLWCSGMAYSDFELDTSEICTGDILEISESGIISKIFSADTSEADIFVTNKCNSNCIMCPLSENARKRQNPGHTEWLKKYIRLLPLSISYINVTGGEPTLAGNTFFEIMYLLKEKFQYSGFQLLTNGRSLADERFLKRMMPCLPSGIRFAVPFHSAHEDVHDEITCSKGSFCETVQGIHNLLSRNFKVEIRIVISKKNMEHLFETSEYIVHHFKGLFCVNFIAMEMMGNAAKNKDLLWDDYPVIFRMAKKSIIFLVKNGIDVQLYNFPLCAVEKGFWHIAVKSITEHKIRYMDACTFCSVKSICGGFFYSTKQLMHPQARPIKNSYENKLF